MAGKEVTSRVWNFTWEPKVQRDMGTMNMGLWLWDCGESTVTNNSDKNSNNNEMRLF